VNYVNSFISIKRKGVGFNGEYQTNTACVFRLPQNSLVSPILLLILSIIILKILENRSNYIDNPGITFINDVWFILLIPIFNK
jgi:hypothetical protein